MSRWVIFLCTIAGHSMGHAIGAISFDTAYYMSAGAGLGLFMHWQSKRFAPAPTTGDDQ